MQRTFKRAFKRAGIRIEYSKGFNPHPLMSFAQPLSLGYSSKAELLEFRTEVPYDPEEINAGVNGVLPEGIRVLWCRAAAEGERPLAARCEACVYEIRIPTGSGTAAGTDPELFLGQREIFTERLNKKKKKVVTDIRPKIRRLETACVDDNLVITTELDAGSSSNLSPELLLKAFIEFYGLEIDRSLVEISRLAIICK